jgi:two-component system, cell cycle sensor histidine kinase and response regulator CckA
MQAQSMQFQDELVRGLAHRMNNILTLFHGYLGLMLDNQQLDKPTRDGLAKIKDGARAASELMDRTHALVRPATVVWREVELSEFIPMLRQGLESLRGPHARFELECPQDLPRVWADMGRLKTVLVELVRNAFEAVGNSPGTVRIELSVETPVGHSDAQPTSAAQPIKWVSIAVTDDGPGIDPEIGERIFTPFFSTKRKQSAAGLGLNVASGFVQQLGGVIRHESRPGHTRFQVLLPSRAEPHR